MKRGILALGLIFAAQSLLAQDWAKARLNNSPRHGEWVEIKSGDRTIKAFVVYPERKDKAPVVLVIHEIFGLSDWVRGLCDQLAENGVIVWHDYTSSAGNKTFAVGRYIRDQMKSHDSIFVCAHTTLAIHIPLSMLLEGEARIARFYDEEVLRERHPDGPFHWLHKRF